MLGEERILTSKGQELSVMMRMLYILSIDFWVGGTGVITIQWRVKIECECDKHLAHLGQTTPMLRWRTVQRERRKRGIKNAKED